MSESNTIASSWAIETEAELSRESTHQESSPTRAGSGTEIHNEALGTTDLRHRLRRSRGGSENDRRDLNDSCQTNSRFRVTHHSPLKSPTRTRLRNTRDSNPSRPNYRREKDGLSPLRSPLNSDQRSSRINSSSRRRSIREDDKNKKENEIPKVSSPSKRNRYSRTTENNHQTLNADVQEEKFRRRLDLPSKEESDHEEEEGFLNPEIEEDRIAIERREKQIAYGKSTESYQLYIKTVPKSERCVDRKKHPRTPLKNSRCSRRNWDAQIKAWKKHVHNWANINFPAMPTASRPLEAESGSEASSTRDRTENKEKEEDDTIDLNEEEDDESFLEGFELDYEFGENLAEANSVSQA